VNYGIFSDANNPLFVFFILDLYWRVPVPTPGMEFIPLAQAVQEAYNDFKKG